MPEDFWLIIGIYIIISFVVLSSFVFIYHRRLKKRLSQNSILTTSNEVKTLESNMQFAIPVGLLFFLCSLAGLAQTIPSLDKLLPDYFPEFGFKFSIFLLLASVAIIGYAYWSMKKMFTSWKAMLWIIILVSTILISGGLIRFL
ncbi:MAG: hypothetical protein Q7S18_00535 [bacterium]|nr:hypothetical protein [bacterium]